MGAGLQGQTHQRGTPYEKPTTSRAGYGFLLRCLFFMIWIARHHDERPHHLYSLVATQVAAGEVGGAMVMSGGDVWR